MVIMDMALVRLFLNVPRPAKQRKISSQAATSIANCLTAQKNLAQGYHKRICPLDLHSSHYLFNAECQAGKL